MADQWDPQAEPYVDYLIRTRAQDWGRQPPPDPADAPAPAPAGPPLSTDPTYDAFQRALDSQRSAAGASTNDQIDATNRATAMRLPQIGEQGGYARERIAGSQETRGLLRSGQTEQLLARQRAAEGQQVAGVQGSAADHIAALRSALASQMVGFDQSAAEQRLAAAQRQQEHDDTAALRKLFADQGVA